MLRLRSLSRLQAAIIHLAASVLGTGIVAAAVLWIWYPGDLASISGVLQILLLVVLVDVVLGPVITFIVFDVRKAELPRDLMIVAIVQVAALAYGAYTVFAGRPVYLVYNAQALDLVFASDISSENLKRGEPSGHGSLPALGPQLIAAVMPSDPQQAARIVTQALTTGDDIQYLPEFYAPVERQRDSVVGAIRPLSELKAAFPRRESRTAPIEARFAGHPGGAGFLVLKVSGEQHVAVMDRRSGDLLAIVSMKP